MLRILGYIIALVVGVAAVIVGISGTAQGHTFALFAPCWILVGAGLSWLVASIWRIIIAAQAGININDDPGIFAVLTMPIWPDGIIFIGIIVVGLVVVFAIYAIAGLPH